MRNGSYFYPGRKLAKFMIINLCGLVMMQNTITQKMINLHGSVGTQKTSKKNMSN